MNVKMDWRDGDYFTFRDYNRIVNNVLELCDRNGWNMPAISTKTISDVVYVDDFNNLVSWLNTIGESAFGEDIPLEYSTIRLLRANQPCYSSIEINCIEQDIALLDLVDFDGFCRTTEDFGVRVLEDGTGIRTVEEDGSSSTAVLGVAILGQMMLGE